MRGISKIIEVILVIIITISLIALIYTWSFNLSFSTQENIEKNLLTGNECLKIESIDTVNKKITIRNCGESDLSDFKVYLDDEIIASDSKTMNPGDILQIDYTADINPGDYNIKVSSDYAESPTITFSAEYPLPLSLCQINITSSQLPYTITQNNTYYCLNASLQQNLDYTAITFASSVQNSTLDCQGFNIDGNDASGIYGVYLTGSYSKNNTIKNCNITDFYFGINIGSSNNTLNNNTLITNRNRGISITTNNNTLVNNTANSNDNYYGIYMYNSNYNTLINNTANSNNYGIALSSSDFNILVNNTANSNSLYGFGFSGNSVNNTLIDNIAYSNDNFGVQLSSSYNNTISGGSISNSFYVIHLTSAGETNYFENINFTDSRKIYFADTTSWFNYNNETNGNIWLKTQVSASRSITRKLVNWNNNLMQWNDTSSSTVTATYNLTGLLPNNDYNVYNNSIPISGSPFDSGVNGMISFAINLPANQECNITVVTVTITNNPPQYFNNGTNVTNPYPSQPILHYVNWSPTSGTLSGYIFSNNYSGSWINSTWTAFSGTWSNQTNTSSSPGTYGWRVYANNSYNLWNDTGVQIIKFSDIILWFKFNEGNGTNVSDYSPYHNDGIFSGESFNDGTLYGAIRVDGKYGSGLRMNYDTSGQYVNISGTRTGTNFTVSLWIYMNKVSSTSAAIVVQDTNNGLGMGGTGFSHLQYWQDGSSRLADPNALPTNSWQFVTLVSNTTHEWLYVNGAVVAGPAAYTSHAYNWKYIGKSEAGENFNATVDEVRIWNRSLNQTEIQADMQSFTPITRPVASYRFEESGNYANDTHIWVNGTNETALSFDNSTDKVTVQNSASLNSSNYTNQITVEGWIRLDSTYGIVRTIAQKGANEQHGFWLGITPTEVWWEIGNGTPSTYIQCDVSFSFNTNTWYYIAGTYNGTHMKTYINGGVPKATCNKNIKMIFDNNNLYIGRGYSSSGSEDGAIDNVRIYNRELSQAEIQTDMYSG